MEFLSQDREIGPELMVFLTDKLKRTKEALDYMEQENRRLQTELANVQIRPRSQDVAPKSESDDWDVGLTCQRGICPSFDQLSRLKETIRNLESQLETQSQEHQAEVARLQELVVNSKAKYSECKTKLKECRKELEGLRDDSGGRASTEKMTEPKIISNEETPESKKPATRVPTLKDQWRKSAAVVCLPFNISTPYELPVEIRHLSSEFGFLFVPEFTEFSSEQDDALVYLPQRNCTPSDRLIWLHNNQFDEHMGKTRDFFYWGQQNGVCYAGSFKYMEVAELSREEFRNMKKADQELVIERTFTKVVTPQIWNTVKSLYCDGKAKVARFRLTRVGFNQQLFDAMIASRNLASGAASSNGDMSQSATQTKRKAIAHPAAPAQKAKRRQ